MTFQEIQSAFQNQSDRAINKVFTFLYHKQRRNVGSRLWRSGCKDEDWIMEIFHEALIRLMKKFQEGAFKGNTLEEIYGFLQQSSFFIWGNHPENPKRKQMNQGRTFDETYENNDPKKISFDSQEPDQVTGIIHSMEDYNSVEEKERQEAVSKYVNNIINNMEEEDCKERIRLSKHYQTNDVEKVEHEEIAEDMGDKNEKSSRRRLALCLKKLRASIQQLLKSDDDLDHLLSEMI